MLHLMILVFVSQLSKVTEDLMLLKAQRSGTNSYYSLEAPGKQLAS